MSRRPLRVLQVIDSLEPGGSEKMAVQIANVLSTKIELSALVCTRQSGTLKEELSKKVLYSALHKKSKYDIKAFLKLRTFVKSNRINIIHAHSTSFFWSTLIKIFCRDVKLIWHDHYGMSNELQKRPKYPLKLSSYFFDSIIAVNQNLKNWSLKILKSKSVYYLPNFTLADPNLNSNSFLRLKGNSNAYKVIHVANLRPQKDHLTALKAIHILIKKNINISYHIVGAYDSESNYYQSLVTFIRNHNLHDTVFIYGSQSDILSFLKQADLGILSSVSEGLPVSLLEYIKAQLPVVVTDVGQCKGLVGNLGIVVKAKNENELAKAIFQTLELEYESKQKAKQLEQLISQKYNSSKIIEQLIDKYTLSLQTSM